MRALYYDEPKGHTAIRVGDFPEPEINDNEVLVRVKAFSLNHLDVWVMEGKYPVKIPMPHIFGSDASGVVEQAGKYAGWIKAGDEVIVHPGLSCGHCEKCMSGRDNECMDLTLLGVVTPGVSAEYVKVPAANIFKKPEGLSFEEAAGLGITYATSWNSLVLKAEIRQADTVLILGGGSGVGTALIQIARLYNAKIITTVGDEWKVERAKAIGADYVINHNAEDIVEAVKKVTNGGMADIVVDHVGAATFGKSLAAAKKGGRVITFGTTTGDEVPISLRHIFGRGITIHGVYTGPKSEVFRYLKLFPHKLRTVVDSVFEFEDAQKAYAKLLSRQFFGKIVVRV